MGARSTDEEGAAGDAAGDVAADTAGDGAAADAGEVEPEASGAGGVDVAEAGVIYDDGGELKLPALAAI